MIRALQLIMSLSLLVVVHELGHFLFARLFKVRVEKFCLFFDPWFSLFKFKPKNSHTKYVIGWLPLGGYVKISGMVDESMDTEQMKQPVQPWEFRSKPAGQRLLIMTAGVIFNFLLALFIYSMILFAWGESYISVREAPWGMQFSETAKNAGFRDGDVLLSADGKEFDRYNLQAIVDAERVTVLRDGRQAGIDIPGDLMKRLMADSVTFATWRYPFVVDSIIPNSPIYEAGMQRGDSIVGINGKPITVYQEFVAEMSVLRNRAKENPEEATDRRLTLDYYRNGEYATLSLVPDEAYMIGTVTFDENVKRHFSVVNVKYGFFESFPAGISLGVKTLKGYVGGLKHLFSKEGVKQLGGFGTIGSIFPAKWDWQQFWYMTAFLSIILAFMNILPIPALDGGHVLFLLYEIITRRRPSDKFMEYATATGLFLLLALIVWANFNDVLRFLF